MTIAIGFHHPEGVLLCADTEMTAFPLKAHGTKVANFATRVGHFAMVLAGHVNNATATIQKVYDQLRKSGSNRPLAAVEHIIDREYRRLVLFHPPHRHDDLSFDFIIVFKPVDGPIGAQRPGGAS